METLFFVGIISWIIQIISTLLNLTMFNQLKSKINDPASLPTWFTVNAWIINLSSLAYWICTILIFFSFQSPLFMIAVVVLVTVLVVLLKRQSKKKTPVGMTDEERANFTLSHKDIFTIWLHSLPPLLLATIPYILLFLTL